LEVESRLIAAALVSKIDEQIERSLHLIEYVPPEQLQWKPPVRGARTTGELLGHLLDCMAGFCAVLYAAYPESLGHFASLRELPVNQACPPDEAGERIRQYHLYLDQGFKELKDEDLSRKLPTVFVDGGETLLTLLLRNLEHLINHKHELFMYLKLVGLNPGTADLYRLRG
jgi:uncharacterized damage-inducible protein DinB